MGGSLIAAALIFQLATTKPILQPWGYGLLALTLLTASFFAWKEEYQKVQLALADAPRIEITDTYAFVGSESEMDRAPGYFAIFARVENPGRDAISFKPDWRLGITSVEGKRAEGLRGRMRGEIRPLQQGDQFNVILDFPYVPGVTDVASLTDASMVLTGTDLRGRTVHATFLNTPRDRGR